MLAVCTSYCIDFLQRHMKRQHAAVVTIQIYTDLEGCIQPIMESWRLQTESVRVLQPVAKEARSARSNM